MYLLVNGRPQECPEHTSIPALLALLGLPRERVAVQLNLDILARERLEEVRLKEGDRLEIVHMVGGG